MTTPRFWTVSPGGNDTSEKPKDHDHTTLASNADCQRNRSRRSDAGDYELRDGSATHRSSQRSDSPGTGTVSPDATAIPVARAVCCPKGHDDC